jgi:hypothetical protein
MSASQLTKLPRHATHRKCEVAIVKKNNKRDKSRFEHLKADEKKRGQDDATATEIAAYEVKEMRKREGRSKVNKATKNHR